MPEYFQPNLPLLDQDPVQPSAPMPTLSPSEEFRLANPDFVEPARTERDWDPNARRSAQLERVGGGLRAGIDGELESVTPVTVNRSVPVSVTRRPKRPVYESRYGDSESSFGRPDYYEEPDFLTAEEKRIGKIALQKIRDEQAERAKLTAREV